MNINKILILFFTILFFQFQSQNLNAQDTNNLDDEELPAIDPFAGSAAGSTNQSVDLNDSQQNSNDSLLNNMRLAGTIIGESKKIAVFSSPDGGAFKFEEGEFLTSTTLLIKIFSDVVIVKNKEDKEFEVYMNNIVRPREG